MWILLFKVSLILSLLTLGLILDINNPDRRLRRFAVRDSIEIIETFMKVNVELEQYQSIGGAGFENLILLLISNASDV